MLRPALLLLPILLAACAGGAGPEGRAERDPRLEACRAEATRVVQRRERGQVMRTDEAETSRGTLTAVPRSRLDNDSAFARMDRDEMVAGCMRGVPGPGGGR